MTPIVFALIPTIVGSGEHLCNLVVSFFSQLTSTAILIGMAESGNKGVLLFGDSHRGIVGRTAVQLISFWQLCI